MINYICAALCGLCALLLVVILRQRRKIRFLRQIVDQAADESARKLIAGIVYKLREKRLINDDGTAPEETTKSE